MVRRSRKAQIFSTDLIIGLLIFVLIVVIFYFLLASKDQDKVVDYSQGADIVAGRLIEVGLIDPQTGELNQEVYDELSSMTYEEVREKLGVSGEFCLFLESTDSPPKLLILNNRTGIGNPDFIISNMSCGTMIP